MRSTISILLLAVLAFSISAQETAPAATANAQSASQAKTMRIKMSPPIVSNGLLIHPQPIYAQGAKDKKVEGTVKLHVVIATDGTIKQLDVLFGDPLLTQPTLDAVRQWKYRPTLLNGQPVEVDTEITAIFKLSDKKHGKAK